MPDLILTYFLFLLSVEKPADKFNSLPTRSKKSKTKPVERSVSDAAAKKPIKRPTIFSLFSRKSDTNIDQSSKHDDDKLVTPTLKKSAKNSKKVGRSKSDIGTTKESHDKRNNVVVRKRNNSENEDQVISKKKTQLSPIIEVTQREDYFTEPPKPPPPPPPQTSIKGSGNIGYTNQEDLDLIPTKPIGDSIKDTILTTLSKHSKSMDDMHSSQQPQDKLPLTKGLTVDGMVKRLSMERFSPPPNITGPIFSYTRPNDQNSPLKQQNIIYAQVVCDNNGKNKQTIHSSSFLLPKEQQQLLINNQNNHNNPIINNNNNHNNHKMTSSSQINFNNNNNHKNMNMNVMSEDTVDHTKSTTINDLSSHNLTDYNNYSNDHSNRPINNRNNSDEDEGLGYDLRKGKETLNFFDN